MNNKYITLLVSLVLISTIIGLIIIGGEAESVDNTSMAASGGANAPESNSLLFVVIIVLSITTTISVSISFYLYRWRRILLSQPNTIVPEEWASYLKNVGQKVSSLSSSLDQRVEEIAQDTRDNTRKIANMTETYMELHAALDEKDKEISRFKNGYDAEIFRKFISRFVRVDHALDDLISEGEETQDLILLKRLLADAFEECGVEKSSPDVGDDYRAAKGVADNPKKVLTTDPDQEFLIAEVIEAGYLLNTGFENKIIIPSKVKIYKLEEEGQ